MALGVAVLGERPGAGAVAGLLLILAGSWLSTDGRLPPGLGRRASRYPTGTPTEGVPPMPLRRISAVVAALVLAAGAAGCGEEDVEDAARDAGNTAEDVGNQAADEAKEAGKDIENEIED